jgi:CheY-like chemotaxis protein
VKSGRPQICGRFARNGLDWGLKSMMKIKFKGEESGHFADDRRSFGGSLPGMPVQSNADQTPTLELDIKNILLVDDDHELADTLKALLESHNFVVTTVNNGVEALREVMKLDFDVIICDMMMPEMPGDMFYLAVQKTRPQLCRRFLFITGHAGNPKVETFLKRVDGMALFKPVLLDELVGMISLVLKRNAESFDKSEFSR